MRAEKARAVVLSSRPLGEADRIVRLLKVRDPLRERVHLNKFELLAFSLAGMIGEVGRRAIGRKAISRPGTAHDA